MKLKKLFKIEENYLKIEMIFFAFTEESSFVMYENTSVKTSCMET